jgi:hypothetical protein
VAEFEYEFLRERLRSIRLRLARPERLSLAEITALKAEALSLERAMASMRR